MALAVLCVGAVAFLLRVLLAFVKEEVKSRPRDLKAYLAKFNPSHRHGELVVMNLEGPQQACCEENGTAGPPYFRNSGDRAAMSILAKS
jgi:hypothetical protein